MSSRSHDIVDLKEKIALLLRHKVHDIKTQTELAELSGIDKAVINRWLNPTKVGLRDFEKLCEVLKGTVPSELWDKPIEEFADTLELAYERPQRTVSSPAVLAEKVGIDFESRIKDRKVLEKRFEIMKGCWELFFYSGSDDKIKNNYIVYNIIEINELNENGYINCRATYGTYNYHGYCFFVGSVTYFFLEEIELLNEIIVLLTNTPVRTVNPVLNGILLLLTSGGGTELVSVPSAVKIISRHIGSIEKLKETYNLRSVDRNCIRQFVSDMRTEINSDNSKLGDILALIDNHIPLDATPYVLRAKFF